jgi:tetratricopeptide (TPR) repeat protein
MNQLQERIAQFRKMATDDPENELGHFRLGQLLAEDGQHEEAAKSFLRTLEIAPHFSKVYQLLGECRIAQGQRDEAARVLTDGWKMADERGDKMPREAMGKLLEQLGKPVPASKQAAGADQGPGDGFACQRPGCPSGNRAHRLPSPPFPDQLGARIEDAVCADCWDNWLRNFSIKVINELHLDLSTEHGQSEYDKYLRDYLGFVETPVASGAPA